MSFFPKDYKVPSGGSRYLKLETGKNTFRILSDPIIGWEYWTEEGDKKTPVRVKTLKEVPSDRVNASEQDRKAKHFWAMFVYNRDLDTIQVLEVTQATIQAGIKALVDESDWGDPRDYDISINRDGEGLETKYAVTPKPKTELDMETAALWTECKKVYDLNKMYAGENPFGDDEE